MNFEIVDENDANTISEVFRFSLETGIGARNPQLRLDQFQRCHRPSRRHGWKVSQMWNRIGRDRDSSLSFEDVPLTPEVITWAKNYVKDIIEEIQITTK